MFSRTIYLLLVLGLQSVDTTHAAVRTDCPDFQARELAAASACDRNVDCVRIANQYASCPKIQAWLLATAPADGKTITAFDVERGLALARTPFLSVSEASVRFQDCVGSTFSRKECRIYLGLEPLPPDQKVADIDPATRAQHQRMDALLREGFESREPGKGLRGETREALAACEVSLNGPDRLSVCHVAQEKYDACRRSLMEWESRRTAFITELDASRRDLGRNCPGSTPGVASTGMPTTDRWNCSLSVLRNFQLGGCPGFLPNSWNTPLQALEARDNEDRGKASPGRDADATKGSDGSFTSSLFQQSAAQAANNPGAHTAAAAESMRRQEEVNQLTANGLQRQAAILGATTANVTQVMQNTAASGGPSTAWAGVNNSLTFAQQYAQGGGGASPGGVLGAPVGDVPGDAGEAAQAQPSGNACKDGAEALGRELNAINARRPSATGAVESFQYVMYAMQRTAAHLSSGACSGQPDAAAALAETKQVYRRTHETCRQIASNDSLCIPKVPWSIR